MQNVNEENEFHTYAHIHRHTDTNTRFNNCLLPFFLLLLAHLATSNTFGSALIK